MYSFVCVSFQLIVFLPFEGKWYRLLGTSLACGFTRLSLDHSKFHFEYVSVNRRFSTNLGFTPQRNKSCLQLFLVDVSWVSVMCCLLWLVISCLRSFTSTCIYRFFGTWIHSLVSGVLPPCCWLINVFPRSQAELEISAWPGAVPLRSAMTILRGGG